MRLLSSRFYVIFNSLKISDFWFLVNKEAFHKLILNVGRKEWQWIIVIH